MLDNTYDDDAIEGMEDNAAINSGGMDDEALLQIVDRYYENAVSYRTGTLRTVQEDAIKRYYAESYGDGRENEQVSQATTQELATHVKWQIPKYLDVFASTQKLFAYAPNKPEDAQYCQDATDYANHIFFTDNDGLQLIHDLAWCGEVMRLGIARIEYVPPEPSAPETIKVHEGVLQQLQSNPENEILDQNIEIAMVQDPMTGGMMPTPVGGTVTYRRVPQCGTVKIRIVPPERFLFDDSAESLEECRYAAEQRFVFRGDLMQQFPDKADELEEATAVDAYDDGENSIIAQTRLEASGQSTNFTNENETGDRSTDELELIDEFVYVDYNGDGVPELRKILRVGKIILDNVEVDDNEFVVFTPERIPHVLVGRCLYDDVKDIQEISTQLTRNALSNHAMNSNGTVLFNKHRVDGDNIQRRGEGGVNIPVDGDVEGVATTLMVPDTSANSLALREETYRQAEFRTGVSRANQGINPDAFSDTATGIELLQGAGNQMFSSRARQMQNTLRRLGRLILKKIVAYQDKTRSILMNNEWRPMDPSKWNADLRCTVKAALGMANRPQTFGMLGQISMMQEKVISVLGPDNPVVPIEAVISTLQDMALTAGFDDPERYFRSADPAIVRQLLQQKASQPTPEMQKVQAEMQLKQAEMQNEHMARLQKLQIEREDMLHRHALAEQRAAAEIQLQEQKMAANFITKAAQPAVRMGGAIG